MDAQDEGRVTTESGATACASCGVRLPPESDPRTVVFCSPTCYGRDVRAHGVVHIYPLEVSTDG